MPGGTKHRFPEPKALLALTKPITWFPPVWAYGCGLVASGLAFSDLISTRGTAVLLGFVLAGPAICGTSQIVNDWFDRHVDAINEPQRPIPSGRVPGRWALWFSIAWTGLSLALAAVIGSLALVAGVIGLVFAWAYSAPPFRFKRSGWIGPLVVGLCYEGLPWLTATTIALNQVPGERIILIAVLYSLGAHGIMTLNDFKAVRGDRQTGLRSLPVVLGEKPAAYFACGVMALGCWGLTVAAVAVSFLLVLQLILMRPLVRDPAGRAPWYGATGVTSYVLGMLLSAFALGGHGLLAAPIWGG